MKKVILFVGVFALMGLFACGVKNTKNESDMSNPADTTGGVTDSVDTAAGNIPTGVPPVN